MNESLKYIERQSNKIQPILKIFMELNISIFFIFLCFFIYIGFINPDIKITNKLLFNLFLASGLFIVPLASMFNIITFLYLIRKYQLKSSIRMISIIMITVSSFLIPLSMIFWLYIQFLFGFSGG